MNRLHTIIPALEDLDVSSLKVSFQGGGDSGEIYNVAFLGADGADKYTWPSGEEEVPEPRVTIRVREHIWTEAAFGRTEAPPYFTYKYVDREMGLLEAIETIVYEEITDTNVDWINDYGGQGTWSFEKEDYIWKKNLLIETQYVEAKVAWDKTESITPEEDK